VSQNEALELAELIDSRGNRPDDLRIIVGLLKGTLEERQVQARSVEPASNLLSDHSYTGTATCNLVTKLA